MITAAQVKELRELTGAGMMECKKALSEASGDIETACRILQERGNDIVKKKASRETGEGILVAAGNDGENKITIMEIRCETDFVSRNPTFQEKAQNIVNAIHEKNYSEQSDIETDTDIKALVEDIIVTFGENTRIANVRILEGNAVFSYIHSNRKVAAAVSIDGGGDIASMGHDVAMQVSATDPIAIDENGIPEETLEMNYRIFEKQVESQGKPLEVVARIVKGKMNKFKKQSCLLTQPFIKDNSKTVGEYIQETCGDVVVEGFIRCEIS